MVCSVILLQWYEKKITYERSTTHDENFDLSFTKPVVAYLQKSNNEKNDC